MNIQDVQSEIKLSITEAIKKANKLLEEVSILRSIAEIFKKMAMDTSRTDFTLYRSDFGHITISREGALLVARCEEASKRLRAKKLEQDAEALISRVVKVTPRMPEVDPK